MTPLEMALQNQNRCNDTTRIGGVLYCNKSGKIILPMFTKIGKTERLRIGNHYLISRKESKDEID